MKLQEFVLTGIPKYIAFGLSLFCVAIAAYIPTLDRVLFHKKGVWYKRATKYGKRFIWCNVGIVMFSLSQAGLSEYQDGMEKEIRDSSQQSRFNQSLKILANHNDSSYKSTIDALNQKLGDYYMQYNSAQKRIEVLVRDSAKTTIIEGLLPTLTCTKVVAYTINPNKIAFHPVFVAFDAPIKKASFIIDYYIVNESKNEFLFLGTSVPTVIKNMFIGNGKDAAGYNIEFTGHVNNITFEVKGYILPYNNATTDTIKFSDVYAFDIETHHLSNVSQFGMAKFNAYKKSIGKEVEE